MKNIDTSYKQQIDTEYTNRLDGLTILRSSLDEIIETAWNRHYLQKMKKES